MATCDPNPTVRRTGLPVAGMALAAMVVILDQVVKALVSRVVGPPPLAESRWLAGEWLGLDYVRNRGFAFGISLGEGTLTLAISLVAFVLAGVSFWRIGARDRVAGIGLGLMAGGALGNLVDRVRFGYVVDFVAVGPWPRFNVADSAITIGMILLAWSALRVDVGDAPVAAGNTRDDDGQA